MSEPGHGDEVPFTTFELEPLDLGEKRSWRAEEVWRTARNKTNRIALGRPSWHTATSPDDPELSLVPEELRDALRSATRGDEQLWALGLDLTLLPDEGCRFVSAQLSLGFAGGEASDGALPLVRRLRPAELREQELHVQERTVGLEVSASAPVVNVVGGGANAGRTRRTETNRTLVYLSGFGAGTAEAGWRFRLTNAREIPLNATDLQAFVVADRGFRGQIVYSVVARIEIRSTVDRWLTAVFVPKESGTLRHRQDFPPPL
ncbi:hypothetical protein [Streptomyces sp. NPDC050564]|uniref:hypothetical protein n=1 Tax=Streptomyces sp. NPDC050564 TaxID=3365631 RepID=UPI00378E027F